MTDEKEKYARNGIHMGMNGGFVLLSALGDAGKFPLLISIGKQPLFQLGIVGMNLGGGAFCVFWFLSYFAM